MRTRPMGVWLAGWAAVLLVAVALAGMEVETASASLRPLIAPGRIAVMLGLLLLLSVALVLPLRSGGLGRFVEDLGLTVVLAAPVAVAAWDWTPRF